MRAWVASVVLFAAATAATARADTLDGPPPTNHQGQFGLSVRFGVAGRFIGAYNHDYCGQSGSTVCTGTTPPLLDIEAGYGIRKHVELVFAATFGLGRDFGASPSAEGSYPVRLSAGARFFFSEAQHTQFFVQPMVMGDFTNYRDPSGQTLSDGVGARCLEGFWIDLHRAYGFYVYVGESAEFVRWIEGDVEGGIGIQGRYP
jgi:hypothetical protein